MDSDASFDQIVQEVWNMDIQGCKMYRVVKKLQCLKTKFKSLHSQRYSRLTERVQAAELRLSQVQQQLVTQPFHEPFKEEERRAKEEFNHLLAADLTLTSQRAKSTWVKETDSNSRYFFTLIKERQNRAKISSVSGADGQIITDPKEVEAEFVNYYTQLLGTEVEMEEFDPAPLSRGKVLDSTEADRLCRPFTVDDVKKALFVIPNSKAPGPDGYSAGFFKAAWDTVGEELSAAVLDFFSSGRILGQINATNIAIVPKVRCPKSVSDYRPISCCNIVYKLISKLLSDRLAEVLPELVDNTQSAFVRGRSIT